MPNNDPPPGWPDPRFNENRGNYPLEKLIPFEGKFVAWKRDGTEIVAWAEDRAGLDKRLEEIGISPDQVVLDYIDPPDAVYL
jgi:hypothetical protein